MRLIDKCWDKLFEKYDIRNKVDKEGLFFISADQIKEVKEPRLMTKFDTKESLPNVFKNKLAILPVERGMYVIGEFELYMDFPSTKPDIKQIRSTTIPAYLETIDINDIRSEANAINIMAIAGILDDFLEESNMIQTVSGRMGSGVFSFNVKGYSKAVKHNIEVKNSQIEIDGGFENENVFSIIECKNVVHNNFLIRQLYYPTRLWSSKISKPIRPVFMVYSNNIFRLLEYKFLDINDYNSLELVKERHYSLEDISITLDDLIKVFKNTSVEPEPDVTFVQADSFEKVISLIENLNDNPMTKAEIAELFSFKERQSDYYYNACKYLGLAEKVTKSDKILVRITSLGKKLLKMNYKDRQLEYVKLILKHRIFNEMFRIYLQSGEIPNNNIIANRMRQLNLCGDRLINRRASSVRGWLNWIVNLIN